MKILLTSDWHLGRYLYKEKLLSHQATFFQREFFPLLNELHPDLLIVAGDILDKPVPDQETLYFYAELLKELASFKIPSFFILGNHDSRRTALHNYFLELAEIYIIDHLNYFFNPFIFKNNSQELIYFYLLPFLPLYEFLERSTHCFKEIPENINYISLLDTLLKRVEIKKPSILITHFAVKSALESGEEINLKGFSEEYFLPENLFSPFDLTFLGHLHRPQRIKEKIFFSGAPMAYSFETFKEKRGVMFFEWAEGHLLKSELITLNPPYELHLLKGPFNDIMKYPHKTAYVKVILEEEKPIYNAYERLKEKFPNLLSLEYATPTNIIIENRVEEFVNYEKFQLDERDFFKEFYYAVEGKEICPKLWEIFLKNLEEFYILERKEGRLCQ